MGVEHRGHGLDLGVRIEVDQRDLGRGRRFDVAQQAIGDVGHGRLAVGEVVAPDVASIGEVDPTQERRDHLAQLGEHQVGVAAGLGQGVGPHPVQQHLVALAGAVDADVGQRGRGQDASDGIERLGLDRLPVDEVGIGVGLGELVPEEVLHHRHQRGVGVEETIHLPHVAQRERRRQDLGIAVVAVAATETGVVGDVPGRLLEVGGQSPPFEDLGQQVRCLLAREVHPTQLGHGVVAVLEEDPLVELLGPLEPDRGIDREVAGDVEIADELVEEETAQRLGRAGVPGEEGTLDHLGKVHEGEHGAVEVGEVSPEDVLLVLREVLSDVDGHGDDATAWDPSRR